MPNFSDIGIVLAAVGTIQVTAQWMTALMLGLAAIRKAQRDDAPEVLRAVAAIVSPGRRNSHFSNAE